jgi:hypothetical protein
MINWKNLEGNGRGLILSYYPIIRLKGLRKTTKIVSQNIRSAGRDLNPGTSEYEADHHDVRLVIL